MTGADLIDVEIAPVLYVSFGVPAITPDSFFDTDTLVANFAALLGLSPSQIRYVKIVKATASGRSMLTSSENVTTIELTIFENAVSIQNDTQSKNTITSLLTSVSSTIINQFSTNQLQSKAETILNITLLTMGIKQPLSNPNASSVNILVLSGMSVWNEAGGCAAQVPCRVQPIIQLVDENV